MFVEIPSLSGLMKLSPTSQPILQNSQQACSPYTSAMSTLPPTPYTLVADAPRSVVITDINMSIGAMCRFMVKCVIAAIPAAIILWAILLLVGALIAIVFGGLIHGITGPWPNHF